jgi:putative phage-type endonuclease
MADHNAEQNTTAWHEARKGRVTASRVGAILGHNPYQSPEDTMREMVREFHKCPREFEGNIATEWGNKHEEEAITDYMIETGNISKDHGFIPYADWAGCSPDGLIGENGGLEVKCPFGKKLFKAADREYYLDQVLFSLFITDRDWWDFSVWDSKGGLTVERFTKETAVDWWKKHEQTLIDFHNKYLTVIASKELSAPHVKDLERELFDSEFAKLAEDFKQAKALFDEAKAQLDEAKAELTLRAISEDIKKVKGFGVSVCKTTKKGNIQYAKIKELKKLDLESYRAKSSVFWTVK